MVQSGHLRGKSSTLTESDFCVFFSDQFCSLYSGLKCLETTIDRMKVMADDERLRELFTSYARQLHKEGSRMEEMYRRLAVALYTENCEVVEGFIKETDRLMAHTPANSITRDAALQFITQKIIHFLIASYGCLEQMTTQLGLEEITDLINQSLQEEVEYSHLFMELAASQVSWLEESQLITA